jgi:hypothetical protein
MVILISCYSARVHVGNDIRKTLNDIKGNITRKGLDEYQFHVRLKTTIKTGYREELSIFANNADISRTIVGCNIFRKCDTWRTWKSGLRDPILRLYPDTAVVTE